jgi:hypothetical protein
LNITQEVWTTPGGANPAPSRLGEGYRGIEDESLVFFLKHGMEEGTRKQASENTCFLLAFCMIVVEARVGFEPARRIENA